MVDLKGKMKRVHVYVGTYLPVREYQLPDGFSSTNAALPELHPLHVRCLSHDTLLCIAVDSPLVTNLFFLYFLLLPFLFWQIKMGLIFLPLEGNEPEVREKKSIPGMIFPPSRERPGKSRCYFRFQYSLVYWIDRLLVVVLVIIIDIVDIFLRDSWGFRKITCDLDGFNRTLSIVTCRQLIISDSETIKKQRKHK